jgi:hypothetical protein
MDYYERKFRGSGFSLKVCWYAIVGMVAVVILFGLASLFSGCKAKQIIEYRDSVRVEYQEILVPDTVTIEIPAEVKERETKDSTSYLETSMAKSLAKLMWKDGEPWLFHSLENIPQKIEKPIEAKMIYRTRYVTRTEYKDKELSWWEKLCMTLGYIMLLLIIAAVIYGLYRAKKSLNP